MSHDMYDRLYGKIHLTDEEWTLLQTPPLTRLHHISLSSIPSWLTTAGVSASRFEHSVGVAYLAKQAISKNEFCDIKQDLIAAALLHDAGSPPFSHASEYFLQRQHDITHEESVKHALENDQVKKGLNSLGARPETVFELINGQGKYGRLLNGSIDLDNIDNSLRFGLSTGLFSKKIYKPETLAQALTIYQDQLTFVLPGDDILEKWDTCRKRVYEYVYSPANLAGGMMLYRALEFAFEAGELIDDFYTYTDAQAFYYLKDRCNSLSQNLIRWAEQWNFFDLACSFSTTKPSEKLIQLVTESRNRGSLSDELAHALGSRREHVSIILAKDKGFKSIDLPVLTPQGQVIQAQSKRMLAYNIQVYVCPDLITKHEYIAQWLQERLELGTTAGF